jgi:hypothetical protein
MRQRRASKSRQSLGQFRRSRAGGGRPGGRGPGAARARARGRVRGAANRTAHSRYTPGRPRRSRSRSSTGAAYAYPHTQQNQLLYLVPAKQTMYLPTLDHSQLNCGNEERKLNDASRVFPRRAAYRRLESRSICSAVARDEREIGSCNDVGSHRGSSRLSLVDSLDDMVDDKEADFEDDVSRFVLLVDVNSTSSLGCSQFTIRVGDSFDELVRGCGKNRARSRARC